MLGICLMINVPGKLAQKSVRKNAPPVPDLCNCCHRKKKLEVDHIHGSTTFRGWLCKACNTGMGKLGDNLEGLLQAAIYLENDKNKGGRMNTNKC